MEGFTMRMDLKLHLLVGMLLVSVTFPFVNIWSMALCFMFAVGKEIVDKFTGRVCETKDAWYTILGRAIVLIGFVLGGCQIG